MDEMIIIFDNRWGWIKSDGVEMTEEEKSGEGDKDNVLDLIRFLSPATQLYTSFGLFFQSRVVALGSSAFLNIPSCQQHLFLLELRQRLPKVFLLHFQIFRQTIPISDNLLIFIGKLLMGLL